MFPGPFHPYSYIETSHHRLLSHHLNVLSSECVPFISAIEHPQRESFVPDTFCPNNWNACESFYIYILGNIFSKNWRTMSHKDTHGCVSFLYFEKKKKKKGLCYHAVAPYISFIHISVTECLIFLFVSSYYYSLVDWWSVEVLTFILSITFRFSLSLFSLSFSCSLFWIIGFLTIQSIIYIFFFLSCVLSSTAKLLPKEKEK